ncbi:Bax inhibitor-1/YccA family protein [Marinibaculum pumilum]|uniref:Bax inhibitor-1/YccA family protein n=1 Tax=Marinibaculum pumilum TaxID=1766165 RepID=A0ABV7KXL9_9PROT
MNTQLGRGWSATRTADRAVVDQALRSYMLRVYNLMASGLLVSGIVAVVIAMSPAVQQVVFQPGLVWLFILAPIGILFAMSFGINKWSAGTVQGMYWLMVAAFGVSLSTIFIAYTSESIVRVFFITAATFGAMSLYGYTTKRDLSGWGTFLFMGLIGILIASVVNIFLESSMLQFVVSVIGVLIFTGLTAYDTQRIKSDFYEGDPAEVMSKKSIMGAVSLYLNFLNLFMLLMSLLGNRE